MTRGRPKEFDRDEALDRALDLLHEKTPDAVGIAELCRHLGIGRQSFYDTYGSKEQLFLEALRRYNEREFAGINALLERQGPAMGNISDVLRAMAERVKERGKKGCLLASTIVEHGPIGDSAADVCRRTVHAVQAAFTETLERGQAEGELPEGVEPADVAALMISMMFGMANLGRLGLADELMPGVGRALRHQLALSS
jgi:AcrR family transcriptional regulator